MAEKSVFIPVEVHYDDEDPECIKWLVFKDVTTGTKYKLMVDSGAVSLEEVT